MYDVAIIGGGISGCALLYELSRYNVSAVLLERENDLAAGGATKANSAIVHAGYDPAPGSLMAKYNVWGNAYIHELCAKLDVPLKTTGSLVLALAPEECATVDALFLRGLKNGVPGLRILEYKELHALEPNLSSDAICALYAPSAAVVSPWELAVALAETAVRSGGEVWLESEVLSIHKTEQAFALETSTGPLRARFVVNAAGLGCHTIASMLEADPGYQMRPSRGEYFLLDTSQGQTVNHVLFQCPSHAGKGVLVAPTVHGNLIVGPSSDACIGNDTSTTASSLAAVRKAAVRSVPGIHFRENIRNFSGVRSATTCEDFIFGPSASCPGLFHMAGIKSPGLTAAPAMARDMVAMLEENGLALTPNPDAIDKRSVLRFRHLAPAQRARAVQDNPLYGRVVCRCQTITEGEIVDALQSPIPPGSLDGIKRRIGPGMGRCQGGFCGPRVQAIIARELGLPSRAIPQDLAGSDIVTGFTKE